MAKKQVDIIVDAQNKSKQAFMEVRKDLKSLGDNSKQSLLQFNQSFSDSMSSIKNWTDKLGFMDKVAKKTFKSLAASATIYTGAAFRDFMNLNDGISQVNTLYDQTAYSQEKMIKDSITMLGLIPTEIDKITSATYNTISAGASPEHATMYARKFGMSAVAGDADMDVVATAAMGTMNAYKLEADDLNKVLDLQFNTVKEGIVSYSELASSLGTGVLASAKDAGITLEELQGSIAMITKNAIPANIATTSLNQLFNKFTDTNVIKEFKEYGVQIQDANKNTRPLIDIFKDLNYEFDKRELSSGQRKGFLKELVGSENAARALAPLLGDLKEFDRILGQMNNSDGAMRGAFDDRLSSFKNQFKLFWNGLKVEGVETFLTLKPLLDKLMEPFIEKQKLQLDLEDAKDSFRMAKTPEDKQEAANLIAKLNFEIAEIKTAPLEDLQKALKESVFELNRINPPLATFLDTIGGFAIKFVGEEGEGHRQGAKNVAKGIGGVYAFKKIVDAFDWMSKKLPKPKSKGDINPSSSKSPLTSSVQSMNVNANIVNVYGKNISSKNNKSGQSISNRNSKLDIPKKIFKEIFKYEAIKSIGGTGKKLAIELSKLIGLTKAGSLALEGSGVLALEGSKLALESSGFVELSAAELFSAISGALVTSIPVFAISTLELISEKEKNDRLKEINKNPDKWTYSNLEKKFVTKEQMQKINENKKKMDRKNNVTIGPAKGSEDVKEINKSVNLLKDNLSKDLANLSKKESIIDNTIDLQNKVKVDAPKVSTNVYIDGKNIPVQRVDVKTGSIERNREITLRRYGRS